MWFGVSSRLVRGIAFASTLLLSATALAVPISLGQQDNCTTDISCYEAEESAEPEPAAREAGQEGLSTSDPAASEADAEEPPTSDAAANEADTEGLPSEADTEEPPTSENADEAEPEGISASEPAAEDDETDDETEPVCPAAATSTPTPEPLETNTAESNPAPVTATETPSRAEATFRLCGGPDPQAERAIEQLIDGRSFRARLISRADGCADLTITVQQQSSKNSILGSQSTALTVSTGSSSGTGRSGISVRIVTQNGVTRVMIGAGT